MGFSKRGSLLMLARSVSGRHEVSTAPTRAQTQVAAYLASMVGPGRVLARPPGEDAVAAANRWRTDGASRAQMLRGYTLTRPRGCMLGRLWDETELANRPRGGVAVHARGKTKLLAVRQRAGAVATAAAAPAVRALLFRMGLECELQDLIDQFAVAAQGKKR
jgi:hypothetical protein